VPKPLGIFLGSKNMIALKGLLFQLIIFSPALLGSKSMIGLLFVLILISPVLTGGVWIIRDLVRDIRAI
jgi:hypothetical protein